MNSEERPDPDKLLKAIQREESKVTLGKLKIFFGMSAGVGKTYTMLDEAHQRLKEGVNLIVGTVNTHGRQETEKMLEGLPRIPEKWVEFKGKAFQELDLERILEMKPQLAIIDELAHTNVPGSKHAKRWQDVVEILDAGIDVYTTLNVQHLESRKDLVESIAGITVHETVPDLILERASAIEIVDITPLELLQRLKEGKVYLGDQSLVAAENFFQEDNLTALREIALRFTAEKVDHDLHGILALGKGWKTRERLMVAVGPAPISQQLIRSARRLAFELDAPWVAVNVDTGITLNPEDQARLNRNLQLARDLGAEVITTTDSDVADALQRIANQKNITRLVIGRSTERPLYKRLFQKSMIDRLEKENRQMDILILRQDKVSGIYQRSFPAFQFSSSALSYLIAIGVVCVLTIIGYFLAPFIGYKPIGFIFLFGIFLLSLFVGQGPVLLAAVLSAVSWDVLFIPPIFKPKISDPEDIALVIAYFIAAIILGLLTSRNREKELYLTRREEKIAHLYEIMKEVTKSPNFQYLRLNVGAKLKALFDGEFDILIKGGNNQLALDSHIPILHSPTEQSAAIWCFRNGRPSGWSTDTLPSAEALYLPIKFSKATIGVLMFLSRTHRPLSPEVMNFLQIVTEQLGLYLERVVFEEHVQSQTYVMQIEKLHNAIFRSLSKGFYTPLEKTSEIHLQLSKEAKSPQEKLLFEQMNKALFNLKVMVDNILMISRLESGFISFDKKKHSVKQLLQQTVDAMEDTRELYGAHAISIEMPEEDAYFDFDFDLLKTALRNLLINASEYSPPQSPIKLTAEILDTEFKLSVVDEGSGIPPETIPFIFEKFYRVPGAQYEGIGLGLTIVKNIVDLHQGRIDIQSNKDKGTIFSLILPR